MVRKLLSADCKRGRRKGATSKKRQKASKSVKKFFDTFRPFSPKIVKKRQKVFRHFSTIFARHLFFRPLLGGSDAEKRSKKQGCPWRGENNKEFQKNKERKGTGLTSEMSFTFTSYATTPNPKAGVGVQR